MSIFHAAKSFVNAEFENVRRFDIPWRRRLWLYRNGFLSEKGALWDLSEDTVDEYLSDFQGRASVLGRIDGPYGVGLKNKVLYHLTVSRTHDELLPEVHGLVRDGEFVGTGRFDGVESASQLLAILEGERVVAKPTTAAKGDGVHVLDGRDDRFHMNGRPVTEGELVDHLTGGRDRILEAYVDQADYAAEIYPEAVNTVRIVTMVDPDTGAPFVAAAMHRFGTVTSGTIDNASAGGISAGIDVETGEIAEAAVPERDGPTAITWTETHPTTGTRITGTTVPEWERVKKTVLDLASEYGWIWPYVGWDVVVTDDDGSITVIEGQRDFGTRFLQVHQPLLADERVRRFYEHHGIV